MTKKVESLKLMKTKILSLSWMSSKLWWRNFWKIGLSQMLDFKWILTKCLKYLTKLFQWSQVYPRFNKHSQDPIFQKMVKIQSELSLESLHLKLRVKMTAKRRSLQPKLKRPPAKRMKNHPLFLDGLMLQRKMPQLPLKSWDKLKRTWMREYSQLTLGQTNPILESCQLLLKKCSSHLTQELMSQKLAKRIKIEAKNFRRLQHLLNQLWFIKIQQTTKWQLKL